MKTKLALSKLCISGQGGSDNLPGILSQGSATLTQISVSSVRLQLFKYGGSDNAEWFSMNKMNATPGSARSMRHDAGK